MSGGLTRRFGAARPHFSRRRAGSAADPIDAALRRKDEEAIPEQREQKNGARCRSTREDGSNTCGSETFRHKIVSDNMSALRVIADRRARVRDRAINQARFLAAFAEGGNTTVAARWAHITRQNHSKWMREDPTYPARFAEAEKQATRLLTDEAVRRASEGVSRPVLYKGRHVHVGGRPLYETEYSDTLLMFLLKGLEPERFGDKQNIKIDWDGDLTKLPDRALDAIIDLMIQREAGGDPIRIAELRQRYRIKGTNPVLETVDVTATPVEPTTYENMPTIEGEGPTKLADRLRRTVEPGNEGQES